VTGEVSPRIPIRAIDDTGPTAIQAQQTETREVTVTVTFDGATALQPLDADAATGNGWKAIAGLRAAERKSLTEAAG
jgi:hypothetical protein